MTCVIDHYEWPNDFMPAWTEEYPEHVMWERIARVDGIGRGVAHVTVERYCSRCKLSATEVREFTPELISAFTTSGEFRAIRAITLLPDG